MPAVTLRFGELVHDWRLCVVDRIAVLLLADAPAVDHDQADLVLNHLSTNRTALNELKPKKEP